MHERVIFMHSPSICVEPKARYLALLTNNTILLRQKQELISSSMVCMQVAGFKDILPKYPFSPYPSPMFELLKPISDASVGDVVLSPNDMV